MPGTKIYNSSSPAIYNSNYIESSGGVWKLKDLISSYQTITNATAYANYGTNINLTWANGVVTGTASGGASISGGYLDLTYNDNRYLDFNADLNADSQQTGTIEFPYKSNYNNIPATNKCMFAISKAHGDVINLITLFHFTTGQLIFQTADENGVLQINEVLGIWNPTLGVDYSFSINYDYTTGATRIFIDGTQYGDTIVTTLTRSADIGLLRIGATYLGSYNSNFSIGAFIVYSTVQHTTDYTPDWSVIPNLRYSIINPIITFVDTIRSDLLYSFTENSSKTENDEIKYTHDGKYITGGTWTDSDGTYLQSSIISDNNIYAMDLISTITDVETVVFLHSNDGWSTPELTSLTVIYKLIEEPTISEYVIYGYLRNICEAEEGEIIKVKGKYKIGSKTLLTDWEYEYTTLTDGYFEITLKVETGYEPEYFDFIIKGKVYRFTFPEDEYTELGDLTLIRI